MVVQARRTHQNSVPRTIGNWPSERGRDMRRNERGIILAHVGLMLLVLTAIVAFAVDYGILWMARGQAQNAADAGALAGAVARAYDETVDPPISGGLTERAARAAALSNNVFGAAPSANVSFNCPGYVSGGRCVQVDVFRDGTNGSAALPTYFANVLGIGTQGIKATATAQVTAANTTDCLKPWVVQDKFTGPHGPDGNFVVGTDTYTAPGYTIANDVGTSVTFHYDSSVPSFYFDVVLSGCTGGSCLRDAIANCVPATQTYSIGASITAEPGAKTGPTRQGLDDLIAWDPGAQWDPVTKSVRVGTSCAPNCGCSPLCGKGNVSPRIVYAGVVSPVEVANAGGGRWTYTLVNILPFFVDSRSGSDILAYIVDAPGLTTGGTGAPSGGGFLVTTALVR